MASSLPIKASWRAAALSNTWICSCCRSWIWITCPWVWAICAWICATCSSNGCVAQPDGEGAKVENCCHFLAHLSSFNPFKWRHYQAESILRCVRWYLSYPLSYRQITEIVNERGLNVDHSTIFRWTQRYRPRARPPLPSTLAPRKWFMARRRNLCKSQREMEISLPGSGLSWEHALTSY